MVMREPVEREDHFYVGVDPAKTLDRFAVVVIQRIIEGTGEHEPINGSAVHWRELPRTHFELRWAERLPPRLSYPDAVRTIHELTETAPLRGQSTVCLDRTGIGEPIADMFAGSGISLITITITAGTGATDQGGGKWHVCKQDLIGTLEGALHDGSLKIAKDLGEAKALADEFGSFRRTITGAGRAQSGAPDDTVATC